ncbi:rod shape-determining protein MreC [Lutibacter sp. TH_r2]|uniref:rod shape-determining protein MreC n=1 Tax=Lutibacter sp. TH_r2 TaxID=3082083 RepID=UPI0029547D26|nr:rod shape-determining protein MreC [Lutibacter sp. TH_r2]MDV7187055.1 rod shape-determining protein MreC [Lutibacter sp. TH_r2]
MLFFVLQIIALGFTIQHHSYHKSKFVNSSNAFTGGIYNRLNSISEFVNLKEENLRLIEENVFLKNSIQPNNNKITPLNDTTFSNKKYQYTFAKIINNNYTKPNNFLTINKGKNQGIQQDLGVINSKGIIGVIKNTSNKYASVLSILNRSSKINVKLKHDNHIGTITWNSKNPNIVQLSDIPRQAVLKKGDTIITGGKSAIFPEGILVGTINNFAFENNQYTEINVSLFNDMTSLGYVQIIKNLEREEQLNLEQQTENE